MKFTHVARRRESLFGLTLMTSRKQNSINTYSPHCLVSAAQQVTIWPPHPHNGAAGEAIIAPSGTSSTFSGKTDNWVRAFSYRSRFDCACVSRKLNVEISSKMNAMSRAFSHLLTATSATANWVAMRSHQFQQQRFMSKYLSKSATKRLPLTTKKAGKGYYKGKGGTKEGRITSKARFIVDPKKRLELVVPDLEGFKVCYRVFLRFVRGDCEIL